VEPAPWRFPARNRIVAGLASAVVIVEARERSGALITADFALEEGRDVLAVPGEITSSLSAGTNELIRLGAIPVTKPEDVLEAIGVEPRPRREPSLTAVAQQVLAAVRDGPCGLDELGRRAGLDAVRLAVVVAELELAGAVSSDGGVYRAALQALP
jgi:DNA processing protein